MSRCTTHNSRLTSVAKAPVEAHTFLTLLGPSTLLRGLSEVSSLVYCPFPATKLYFMLILSCFWKAPTVFTITTMISRSIFWTCITQSNNFFGLGFCLWILGSISDSVSHPGSFTTRKWNCFHRKYCFPQQQPQGWQRGEHPPEDPQRDDNAEAERAAV